MVEIETMLKDDWAIEGRDKTPETAVIITNFAPHFRREGCSRAAGHLCNRAVSEAAQPAYRSLCDG
jgi:hypothetical protein